MSMSLIAPVGQARETHVTDSTTTPEISIEEKREPTPGGGGGWGVGKYVRRSLAANSPLTHYTQIVS